MFIFNIHIIMETVLFLKMYVYHLFTHNNSISSALHIYEYLSSML